jgi:YidC/Oxa1 family membrane protein insertase
MKSNPRLFFWLLLGLVLYFNYQAWERDYGQGAQPAPAASARKPATPARETTLDAAVPRASSASGPSAQSPEPAAAASSSAPESLAVQAEAARVRVRTDVLDVDIGVVGGELQRADLPRYPKVKGGREPVRLLNRDSSETVYVIQSGLTGPEGAPRPTHNERFEIERSEYSLGDANELRVPLTWRSPDGVEVTKTYTFRRGSYRIDVDYDVRNRSGQPWQAASYAQLSRTDPPAETSMFSPESYAFRGPALWDGERYRKLDIEDEEDRKLAVPVTGGWLAALQHHFVSAIVPPKDEPQSVTLAADQRQFVFATAGAFRTVAPGGAATFRETFFIGPKLQKQLEATAPERELDRVADYGRLYLLAEPLFSALEIAHNLVGNWGWAIVLVTLLLKLLFYPLSEASGRSMAKMKALAPRIKNLQENYKDDREKLGREMMALYQREKVNPVAGCLPILIQIPVFLAFYWVLVESVEMRQAPFMGWINDLSSRDPWFVLPAIMAAAMFVQYKLNPQPPDPVQQKVFMVMPFAMSVMFAFFPAGLVLYWVTNTVLSIAQQWNINRRIEKAVAAKRTS